MSSLENGLRILMLLNERRRVLRVGEVCRDLAIPKASVSRLLRTLSEAGLLERDVRDGSYRAGLKALDLGRLYLDRHDLLDLVTEAVEALVEEFGFTGHAGIVVGSERVLLLARQGSYPLQHTGGIAERKPAFDSIIGRAILARRTNAEALDQLGFRGEGERIGGFSAASIVAELEAIRRARIASSSNLVTPGISSVGAAVTDPARGDPLAFCLSYPSVAADDALRAKMTKAVLDSARTIGARVRDPVWCS